MMKRKKLYVVCNLILIGCFSVGALFSGESEQLFEVSFGDLPVIQSGKIGDVRFIHTEKNGKGLRVSTTDDDVVVPGYLETMRESDRAEITLFVKFPSSRYAVSGKSYERLAYTLRLSPQLLEGAKVVAHHSPGRGNPGELVNVDLEGVKPESGLLQSGIYYLEIERPDGRHLTFDLNPMGLHSAFHDYLRGTMGRENRQNGWRLEHDDQGFFLLYGVPDMGYGGQFDSKVIVYDRKVQFEDIHSTNRHSYTTLNAEHAFVFGMRPGKNRTSVGTDLYSESVGYGWESNTGISLDSDRSSRLMTAGRVYSNREGRFLVDVKNGTYLVNLSFGAPDWETGPFDLSVNGEKKLTDLHTDKGVYSSVTTWVRVIDGQVKLELSGGPWSLNAIGLSTLGYMSEDYEWSRDWWLDSEGWERWINKQVPLKDLGDIEFEESRGRFLLSWARGAHIDTFAGAIDHTRSSMDQPYEVEARVQELVEQGTKATIVNGDHFRLGLMGTRWDEVNRQNLRLIVEESHKHGLMVIEHLDINWAFPGDYGRFLEVLDQDPYSLQRHAGNPLVVQSNFCLNSPAFFEMCVDYLHEQTRKTGVDGFMIDEMVFYGDQFCGCDRCRVLFHEDTGLELPYADPITLNEIRRNGKSPLWRAWVRWRGEKIYQMRSRLMEEVRKVNPNSMLFTYNAAPISYARGSSAVADMGMPSASDFWGIEYHPDDALANWRNLFSRLKLDQAVARSWGKDPAWVLAKVTRTPSHFLQVWGITQMTHNALWFRAVNKEQTAMLTSWKYAMVTEEARPLTDVAVVYSQRTVDVTDITTDRGRDYYMEEFGGWCQSLAESNIQYDVLNTTPDLERDLKPYKVVILPNVASMSDEQAEVYQRFVKKGGTVVASFQTGFLDETGVEREQPWIEKWLDVQVGNWRVPTDSLLWRTMGDYPETQISLPGSLDYVELNKDYLSELYVLTAVEGYPFTVIRKHGKGRFVYITANVGQVNYEPRIVSTSNVTVYAIRAAQGYTVDRVPALEERLTGLIRELLGKQERVVPVSVPEGVVYTAWDSGEGQIVLHFLNCTGRLQLEKGETLPRLQELSTPVIEEEIVVEVHSEHPVGRALYYNVGSEEGIPCSLENLEGSRAVVRIPAGSLIHYGNLICEIERTED